MTWVCVVEGVDRDPRHLVVRCLTPVTWHEVRAYAAKKFSTDPAAVLARPAEAADEPTVEIRHVGNDYAGSTGPRRLQERVMGRWVDA